MRQQQQYQQHPYDRRASIKVPTDDSGYAIYDDAYQFPVPTASPAPSASFVPTASIVPTVYYYTYPPDSYGSYTSDPAAETRLVIGVVIGFFLCIGVLVVVLNRTSRVGGPRAGAGSAAASAAAAGGGGRDDDEGA
jgi:hypothetical protein